MKAKPVIEAQVTEDTYPLRSPIKVCMHLAEKARNDARLMRDATALVEAGFMVTIIDVENDRTRADEEYIDGVHLKHIFMPSYFVSARRFKLWFLVKLAMLTLNGTFQLLGEKADIYHAHVERALPACYIAARLRRKPFIIDTPDLTLSDPTITRWPRLRILASHIYRHMTKFCAGYITASPFYAKELGKLYGVKGATIIRNVPPYKTVTKNHRLHQSLGLDPKTRIVLYQGALQPNRALDRLVRVPVFLDPNIVIVMMGNDSRGTRVKLETLIKQEGMTDRIKIIPAVPYKVLLDWTASADLGLTIFPPDYSLSIRFTLPNKFFEYLMAGVPVLSSQLDAISEMIERYKVGKVLASITPEDIGSAINGILADHDVLARMSSNALQAAKQEFNWEKEKQKLINLYEEILLNQEGKHAI